MAILYDCHSIRSGIPFLFEGMLPDPNVGTAGGASRAPAVEAAVLAGAGRPRVMSCVAGRLRDWTTGTTTAGGGVHAVQMELAQATYLAAEAPPWGSTRKRGGCGGI